MSVKKFLQRCRWVWRLANLGGLLNYGQIQGNLGSLLILAVYQVMARYREYERTGFHILDWGMFLSKRRQNLLEIFLGIFSVFGPWQQKKSLQILFLLFQSVFICFFMRFGSWQSNFCFRKPKMLILLVSGDIFSVETHLTD